MGSGKTTVGERLAGELSRTFHDTDRMVEEKQQKTIQRIFEEEGEACFRELEWEALRSMGDRPHLVIATGGGLFAASRPRRYMKARGLTVWLDVPIETSMLHVGEGSGRPLWAPEDPLDFRAFFERRRAAYALADLRIAAADSPPEKLVQRVLSYFR